MAAFAVESAIATVCALVKLPGVGEKVGVTAVGVDVLEAVEPPLHPLQPARRTAKTPREMMCLIMGWKLLECGSFWTMGTLL
jgi:hypothetical protein